MKKTPYIFILFCSMLFFLIGFFTLSDYGINWDEPVHYIRGQAFLRYLVFGQKNYESLPKIKTHYQKNENTTIPNSAYENDSKVRRSIYQMSQPENNLDLSYTFFENKPPSHPSLNGVLASMSNMIFYQWLGVLGDIESYHLFVLLISSLGVALIGYWGYKIGGTLVSIVSLLSLSLYPLYFAESKFNIKDPVEAVFYAYTLYFVYYGIVQKRLKFIYISSIFAGISFATKFNIVFSFITVFVWLTYLFVTQKCSIKEFMQNKILFSLLIFPFVMVAIFILSYPTIWSNPMKGLLDMISYYKEIGSGVNYHPEYMYSIFGLNTYALQWILYITPLPVLMLTCVGILSSITRAYKKSDTHSMFILLWFSVPIIRVTYPGAGIYGGVRQIMEYILPMSLLSGIGFQSIHTYVNDWLAKSKHFHNDIKTIRRLTNVFFFSACIIMFIPLIYTLKSIHPNENVYFNYLIGGLHGAKERNFTDWGVTLGSQYRQGVNWMNNNASKNSKLTLVYGLLSNIPRIWLRSDIYFGDTYYSGDEMKGEYIMEIVDAQWNRYVTEDQRKYLAELKPLYQVRIDDVTILSIWRNDKQYRMNENL